MKAFKGKTGRELSLGAEEGVSPVIATILMVAITVILAVSVYALVSYYTPGPLPLIGSLSEETSGNNTVTLMLELSEPSVLKNPSDFHLRIINASTIGPGWKVLNATIVNPDGSSVILTNFVVSGNIWTSESAIASNSSVSIVSGAFITIYFSTQGKPVNLSDMSVVIFYSGTTGTIPSQPLQLQQIG
ncbi:MAG: archaellin/type IV pilin N-terminal domain-containing protein [Thermoplasmatales archaeon]